MPMGIVENVFVGLDVVVLGVVDVCGSGGRIGIVCFGCDCGVPGV